MPFPQNNEPEDLLWWEMVTDFPELGDGLEELGQDPEAGVVAAVGIFTMLQLRFWQRFSNSVSTAPREEHQTDDSPPPQASSNKLCI